MCKYGRMQKKIPPQLVCGSRSACLDSMLPACEVQVTLGWDFYLRSSHVSEDSDFPAVMRNSSFLVASLVG